MLVHGSFLLFFLHAYFFLSVIAHPNSYCKGYCSTNYYCSPNSCRRSGRFYCSCAKCPSGKISSSGSWTISQCVGCPSGKYFSSNKCVACAAGKYQPYASQSSCYSCPCGTYSGGGATSCVHCPIGKY